MRKLLKQQIPFPSLLKAVLVIHVLTTAGLDGHIIHSTPSELIGVIERCSKDKVTYPSCSFNSAYGFKLQNNK